MAKRTPEEIRAQREAWLAKKAAREAGQEIPAQQPDAQPEAEAAQPSPEPAVARPPAEKDQPQAPKRKRTPEEIKAQREAFLAAKAAKAAGAAPAKATPAPAAQAEKPGAPVAQPAAKPAPARPASQPKKPAPKAGPVPTPPDSNLSRREFLNYAWLASIALFSAQTVGLSLWFAFPNFKAGQFGGQFPIGQASGIIPEVNSGPVPYTDGKFWLVNVDREIDGESRQGVLAIYKVCTHLGCLYEWVPMTSRFECPCHGSKFELTGDYIAGPARRSLDRFVIQAVAPDGTVKETNPDGDPLVVDPEDTIIVDTGQRILGSSDIVPA
jgi:cytochrome b6-f complex iron-sulfur subunit